MHSRRYVGLVVAALSAVVATLAATTVFAAGNQQAPQSGYASSAPPPFTVTSTLDGKRALPHRIRWLASPSAPATRVEFLIDGKVRWIEQSAPFTYSDDGGYLVTSWLSPGRHRFAVRATSVAGKTVTKAVVARVGAAPAPPSVLAGKWQRVVDQRVPADPGCAPGSVPAGRWTLVFERRWIEAIFPGRFDPQKSQQTGFGFRIDSDWIPAGRTFEVAGSVTIDMLLDTNPRGGWWCQPGGPKATYTWSVSGDTLTLTPNGGRDTNRQRGTVFTGRWTRAN